jgi:predicted PurR-regulated permease PerM
MPANLNFLRGVEMLVGSAIVLGLLYWLQPVVIPIALAILLTFLLSPLVTWLQRRRFPRAPAVVLVVLVTFASLGSIGWLIERQVASLVDSFPQYEQNLSAKLVSLHSGNTGLIDKMQRIVRRITGQLQKSEPTERSARQERAPTPLSVRVIPDEEPFQLARLWSVFSPVLAPLAGLGLTIVLLIYMLIRREDLRDRVISLIGHGSVTLTTRAIDEAGERISHYLLMQLLVNIGYGVAVAVGLFLIGVPYALLWGFLGAVLRYVPYLGPWLAALLPVGLSFLVFEAWTPTLLVVGLYLTLDLIINMLIEPWFYGRGIGVSETAILVMVAFWSWLWGPIGLVLATPLTVCLVVLGRHVPFLKFFDTLLGDQPVLDAPIGYYQRLLARDQDEAADIAEAHLKEASLEQTYDEVLLPSLAYAKRDLEREALSVDDQRYVLSATREVAEGLLALQTEATPSGVQATINAEPSGERFRVLGVPARDESDEIALLMFKGLLDADSYDVTLTSAALLASEVLESVQRTKASVLCIAAVAPGGAAQARLLCLRLHARFPELKILVGRWAAQSGIDKIRAQLLASGATEFGTTLEETCDQVAAMRAVGLQAMDREQRGAPVT